LTPTVRCGDAALKGTNMIEPIRVLQVLASLDRGGAETVVMNWLRHMDRQEVVFDFVVNEREEAYAYEQEARELGSRILRAPVASPCHLISYVSWWIRALAHHPEWKIVHAHHTTPAFIYLTVARILGRSTIAHSHSAGGRSPKERVKAVAVWPLRFIPHVRFGCSRLALKGMYGSANRGSVIPNAIDVERFEFDPALRSSVRDELGLQDHLIVGHIGRFHPTKNHQRLLEVFAEVLVRRPDARLLLIGDGDLRLKMENASTALGIERNVVFLGIREDIPALLSSMDVFVLPSHHEGLPVVIVEAQASGLPCVVSDAVTSEVAITDVVRFLSLSEPNSNWATAILDAAQRHRRSAAPSLRNAGYSVRQVTNELARFYIELDGTTGGLRPQLHPRS